MNCDEFIKVIVDMFLKYFCNDVEDRSVIVSLDLSPILWIEIILASFNFEGNERATLARATRVAIHSYLYSGHRPSVRGKITPDNGNLRNLR